MTINTGAGPKQLPVIDILNAMSSKLNAYYARQDPKDYRDIFFLIMTYHDPVLAIRSQLNATHCQYFVASFAEGNVEDAIKYVKGVLGVP